MDDGSIATSGIDPFTPAISLARAIRAGELSPVELLDAVFERMDRLNPDLNAIIWRNDDDARAEARALADTIAKGDTDLPPFAGVPLPIKDLTPVAGWPVTYGSRASGSGPSAKDAPVVAAFRRGGFLLTARTNTPELGAIPAAENLRYGITRNPYNLHRTPGGSSGGAAAAVASGMVPLAHGNDGDGSLRIPASCSGLVGMKVSRGRVPVRTTGLLGAATEGVLTRTVADTAAVLDVIARTDELAWYNAPSPQRPFADEVGADTGRLRIGLLERAPLNLDVADGPLEAVQRTGVALEGLGHDVVALEFELYPVEAVAAYLSVMNAVFGEYDDIDFTRLEPHNAAAYAEARTVDSVTAVRAIAELQRFSREMVSRWGEEFDLLVTPTMAVEPPPAGSIMRSSHTRPDVIDPIIYSLGAFTAGFSVCGLPAISLPVHMGQRGVPVGVQLVGGPWQDGLVLRVAAQIEGALPWDTPERRAALAVG